MAERSNKGLIGRSKAAGRNECDSFVWRTMNTLLRSLMSLLRTTPIFMWGTISENCLSFSNSDAIPVLVWESYCIWNILM